MHFYYVFDQNVIPKLKVLFCLQIARLFFDIVTSANAPLLPI